MNTNRMALALAGLVVLESLAHPEKKHVHNDEKEEPRAVGAFAIEDYTSAPSADMSEVMFPGAFQSVSHPLKGSRKRMTSSKSRRRADDGQAYLDMFPRDTARWMNTCATCGRRGYKPDLPNVITRGSTPTALATYLRAHFNALRLTDDGLCEVCANALRV